MSRKEKKIDNKDLKLNRKLLITFIIFLITAILTLLIVLGKGSLFGLRIVQVSSTEESSAEETHTISIVADSYYLAEDGETEVYVTIDGEDVTEGYGLVSSDEEVITVEENVIAAVGEGTATVTAVDETNGTQAEIEINVVQYATSLVLSSEYKTISVDEQTQMSYTYKPTNATVKVSYTSEDEEIATVDSNGVVTGVSAGSVTITILDEISGETDEYTIKVK